MNPLSTATQAVLSIITEAGLITVKELAARTGSHESTIRHHLALLKKLNLAHYSRELRRVDMSIRASKCIAPGPKPKDLKPQKEPLDGQRYYRVEHLIDGPIPIPPIDSLLITLMGRSNQIGVTA